MVERELAGNEKQLLDMLLQALELLQNKNPLDLTIVMLRDQTKAAIDDGTVEVK